MHKYQISQPKDFIPICEQILAQEYPKTIVLQGDLGAGKTTFVRIFVQLLKEELITSSPTFTLMNVYEVSNIKIHHFDLYRLSGVEEALEWGFDEFVEECDFAFIEWAERAIELIPKPYTLISLLHSSHIDQRDLTISIIN